MRSAFACAVAALLALVPAGEALAASSSCKPLVVATSTVTQPRAGNCISRPFTALPATCAADCTVASAFVGFPGFPCGLRATVEHGYDFVPRHLVNGVCVVDTNAAARETARSPRRGAPDSDRRSADAAAVVAAPARAPVQTQAPIRVQAPMRMQAPIRMQTPMQMRGPVAAPQAARSASGRKG